MNPRISENDDLIDIESVDMPRSGGPLTPKFEQMIEKKLENPPQKNSNNGAVITCKEGSNIHNGQDGKRLCSYSGKLCLQRRMEGFGFCIKHILEDPTAPFHQCQFVSKQTKKLCTNPVSIKESDPRYCAAHKQILGLIPRKVPQKKIKKSPDAPATTPTTTPKTAPKKLQQVLSKQGLIETRSDSESSSSFPSDSSPEEESSSESEDDFISETFLEESEDNFEESFLKNTHILTEEELIRRRRDKIKHLIKLYRSQFRRLNDILRNKHQKYLKSRQKYLEDPEERNSKKDAFTLEKLRRKQKLMHQYANYHPKVSKFLAEVKSKKVKAVDPNDDTKNLRGCTYEGCDGKCLPFADFCYAHILKDPKQVLFTHCIHTAPDGTMCNFPILTGQNPPLCNGHLDTNPMTSQSKVSRKRKSEEEKAQEGQKKLPLPKEVKPPKKPKKAEISIVVDPQKDLKKARKKKPTPTLPSTIPTPQFQINLPPSS